MRLAAVMALVAAIAVPAAAHAETVDELFHAFWLFGAWAPDCKRAASPVNPHVSISAPGAGQVLEEHDLGSGFAVNRYVMLTAELLSDDLLSVSTIFQPGTAEEERERLIFRVYGGTRRTMFNQPEGGAVLVKDGVVLSNGRKTPLLHKCD
ncbi:MAG TPA: hypothetical protein VHX61_01820 [Rhizomicrobium sp.]|jgi:hypothetical protein|nr:hypothetical protein [Rhizomicrobium sp.]